MENFDKNEFSIDALFKSDDFKRYESMATKKFYMSLCEFTEENSKDGILDDEFYDRITDYKGSVFNDGFKQGFQFAVKAVKFLMKI